MFDALTEKFSRAQSATAYYSSQLFKLFVYKHILGIDKIIPGVYPCVGKGLKFFPSGQTRASKFVFKPVVTSWGWALWGFWLGPF